MIDEDGNIMHPGPVLPGDDFQTIKMLAKMALENKCRVILEEVGGFRNQPAPSAFNFGRSFGWWEMALAGYGLKPVLVKPEVWQAGLDLPEPPPGGRWTQDQHKKHLIAAAQRLFPDAPWDALKTIWRRSAVADALLIARWGRMLSP